MFILIAGGGKVGYFLAKDLIAKGHEVSLIEANEEKAKRINDELGNITICGDACDSAVLKIAGAGRAVICVGVTGEDEDNLVICQVAKTRFKVPFTLCRVNNPRNKDVFKKLGVDATVSKTEVILSMIEGEMTTKGVMATFPTRHSDVEMVEAVITDESPAANMTLKELPTPPDCTISMIIRDNEIIIPDGNTRLQPLDLVMALAKHKSFASLRELLLGKNDSQLSFELTHPEKG
ncbi:MAG: TrkA family potassium uptake protein [Chloroflexi bacterium]|nr:TrkA family potassium uptake protein [Chloroflexota bacterium]